jgi:hypothetical protein
MRKLTKLLIVLVALQFACSKDDEPVITNGGTFTLDGTSYVLSQGFLVDEGGQYAIILTSSGISLESSNGDDFIGTGDFVFLGVIASSTTSFEPGTFNWSDTGGPNTIEFAEVGVNLDVSGDVEGALEGTGGTASVAKSGDIYTISFSIITDSNTATGSYIGPLTDVQD